MFPKAQMAGVQDTAVLWNQPSVQSGTSFHYSVCMSDLHDANRSDTHLSKDVLRAMASEACACSEGKDPWR